RFWLYRFFFSSRRRHTRFSRDWSSDVCSSDLQSYLKFEQDGARFVFAPLQGIDLGEIQIGLIEFWRHAYRLFKACDCLVTAPREIGRASCRERVRTAGRAAAPRDKLARESRGM